jgi:hypothetical protein
MHIDIFLSLVFFLLLHLFDYLIEIFPFVCGIEPILMEGGGRTQRWFKQLVREDEDSSYISENQSSGTR